jgi:hypothetical protein
MKIILLGDSIGENTTGWSVVVRTVFHQIPPMRILSELNVWSLPNKFEKKHQTNYQPNYKGKHVYMDT